MLDKCLVSHITRHIFIALLEVISLDNKSMGNILFTFNEVDSPITTPHERCIQIVWQAVPFRNRQRITAVESGATKSVVLVAL